MKHIISILFVVVVFCGSLYGQKFNDIYDKKNYKAVMQELAKNGDKYKKNATKKELKEFGRWESPITGLLIYRFVTTTGEVQTGKVVVR